MLQFSVDNRLLHRVRVKTGLVSLCYLPFCSPLPMVLDALDGDWV